MSENLQAQAVDVAEEHAAVENEPDNAKGGFMGLLLASLAIVLAITSYALWIYFQREAELITHEQVLSKQSAALLELQAIEQKEMQSAGVIDKEGGIYRLPFATGKQLFLKEAAERKAQNQPQRIEAKVIAAEVELDEDLEED